MAGGTNLGHPRLGPRGGADLRRAGGPVAFAASGTPPVLAWLLVLGSAAFAALLGCASEPPASLGTAPSADLNGAFRTLREQMVQEDINRRGIQDPLVLKAMRTVPREEFVLPQYRFQAYRDNPLPIKEGQTISQPFMVAQMTELLDLRPGDRVLEIGTGSGYQAAVLAEITDEVYTMEIIPLLATEAKRRLADLEYDEVEVREADGYFGWEEHGPYDAIIVTAAPDHVPQPLLRQLKDGANMVLPVGPPGAVQTLWLIRREGEEYTRVNQGRVTFVPLLRDG